MRIVFYASLYLLLSMTQVLKAQMSHKGTPISFSKEHKGIDGVEKIIKSKILLYSLDSLDPVKLEEIKLNNRKTKGGNLYQFAYVFDIQLDLKTNSSIDSIQNGVLYRLKIASKDAVSINLIFSNYRLPKGATLYLYNSDKKEILGAFTSFNNKKSNRLPTTPIKGDEIIIEYFEPYYSKFKGDLIIGKVNHEFGTSQNKDFGDGGNCQVDINCIEGDAWQTEKRSVVRILKNGSTHCSGALINNTSNDGRAFILTAFHCLDTDQNGVLSIDEQNDVSDYTFIFNYESATCNGGDGSLSQSVSGAYFKAARYESDFALLEMTLRPMSTYNPHYAGWDRNNNQPQGGVGIHHPRGDVKKISTYTMEPDDSDCIEAQPGNTPYPQNNFYLIDEWIQTANGHGVTEGGSSGSPLFNANHRIIGQLFGFCENHNGNCNDPFNDFSNYGKLFSSWSDGAPTTQRLDFWLAPENSNQTSISGLDYCPPNVTNNLNLTHTINSGAIEVYQVVNTINANNIINSGAEAVYEAGNIINLNPGFEAKFGSDFEAIINPINACIQRCDPLIVNISPNGFTPNGDGVNDELCYSVSNATSYEFKAYNNSSQIIHSSSGSVNGNPICVWDGSGGCNLCSYFVIVTFKNNCDEVTLSYYVTIVMGLKSLNEEIENKEISQALTFDVFPNPARTNFKVSVQNQANFYTFDLLNNLGVVIYSIKRTNKPLININSSGFSKGLYIIRISNKNNIVTKKMIIE